MWKGRYRHDAKKNWRQASLYCWQLERFWVAAEKAAQQGMILFPMLPEMRLRLLRKRKQRRTDVYPETITYTLAKMTGVNNSNLPEGETYEDNAYTRLIREIINVQNEDVYENYGDTYNVGISTMIATGNIADIMVVDQKTMNAMQKNDQLADLTEVYANCASDRIKDIYASYGEEILQGCTFDGKLMAFPETNISDGPNLLWVRKDWMEKLGLSVPETIDDVKHIALTFAEENPANQEMGNIGLAVSTTLYGGTGISSEYG